MVWGSSWIAIHYQLGNVPPEASITYRFALAAFVSFFYCYFIVILENYRLNFQSSNISLLLFSVWYHLAVTIIFFI
jgi:hypothetical protein